MSTTPKQIKYQGQLYVRAEVKVATTPHKKCPTGEHWNEAATKCLKLPPGLQQLHETAHKLSDKALKRHPKQKWNKNTTPSFDRHHAAAEQAHSKAAGALHAHGFHALAENHELWEGLHHKPIHNMYDSDTGKAHSKKSWVAPPMVGSREDHKSFYDDPQDREAVLRRLKRAK